MDYIFIDKFTSTLILYLMLYCNILIHRNPLCKTMSIKESSVFNA